MTYTFGVFAFDERVGILTRRQFIRTVPTLGAADPDVVVRAKRA